jgi:translation initiation factor 2 subunit 2
MSTPSYEALLDRARAGLPENPHRSERFTIPTAEVNYDGKSTVVRNLKEIGDQLRREPAQILNFLSREFGCPGVLDGPRGVLKTKANAEQINTKVKEYTQRFVLCVECGSPDTHLDRDARSAPMIVCEACGAQRPVTVRRVQVSEKPKAPVVFGETYRLTVEDVNRRGEGVARKEGFVVFIAGARVKGVQVNAKITRVSGNAASATVVP